MLGLRDPSDTRFAPNSTRVSRAIQLTPVGPDTSLSY